MLSLGFWKSIKTCDDNVNEDDGDDDNDDDGNDNVDDASSSPSMVMITLSREDYQVEESKAGDRVGARPMIRSP